jgi:hypothetical protein
MPYRYLPALSMGLAYFMSFKKTGIPLEYVDRLKMEYEERLTRAFYEDRDHNDLWVYPDVALR